MVNEEEEQADDNASTDKAILFTDDAKNEVGMTFRYIDGI